MLQKKHNQVIRYIPHLPKLCVMSNLICISTYSDLYWYQRN